MATRQTRADRKAETRERLLRAAERIVTDHGFGRLTLEAVAQKAGLTKGAIYSNFASKEELVIETATRLTPGLNFDDALTGARDVPDMLDRASAALVGAVQKRAKEAALLLEFNAMSIRDAKLRQAMRAFEDDELDDSEVPAWLEAHADEIPLPLDQWVHVVNAVATGLMTRRLMEGPEAVPDEVFTWTFRRLGLRPDD